MMLKLGGDVNFNWQAPGVPSPAHGKGERGREDTKRRKG